MRLLRLPRRAPRDEPPPPERLEVTDYRAFLLTAPQEDLVSAHRAALDCLDPFVRAVIRNLAVERTGAGSEVLPEDTAALSDLLVAGDPDRRVAILEAYDDGVRHRLAHAVAVVLQPPVDPLVDEQSPDEQVPNEQPSDEPASDEGPSIEAGPDGHRHDGPGRDGQAPERPLPVIHANEARTAVPVLP